MFEGYQMPARKAFSAPKGTILFSPGQDCPGFLRLTQGCIKVTLTGSSGREVVLYRVHSGEVCLQTFTCLIEDQSYAAEGVVEEDLQGDLIPADQFRQALEQDPDFRTEVLTSVALRFSEYQQLIEDVALTGFDARLAKVLLRLRDEAGLVHATHTALAAETASGRAYVSRRLAEFARRGLVEQRPDGIRICRSAELVQIAEQK
ncbi:Crp/Fnr family transcriptional regulator [Pseudophaeobacter sp.]|uniref:Crp/Fnr family transcriptional regulator n=1 Tax=Pseudophaeobacter sp. TaxID=1971739 RepID=UPI003299E9B2